MNKSHYLIAALIFLSCGALGLVAEEPKTTGDGLSLTIQRRDAAGGLVREQHAIDPAKTAVVVIDMWDRHWCTTYTERVGNMVPRMNRTLAAVRKLGIQVVFAPSDVLDFYPDVPQRQAMQAIPPAPAPKLVDFNPPPTPSPTDHCECGPDEPCREKVKTWTRQQADLIVADADLIADCNNGQELLNLCAVRDIDTLIYMGVASNMCVMHRSMGMINMKRRGLRILVVADLVNAITANGIGADGKPDPNFTPARGTAMIQQHIERYLAPTFESRQLIAAAGLDPHGEDKRPHIVFVIAEQEYRSRDTLLAFAEKYLGDYRCTFCIAKGDEGDDRNDVPGLEALHDADLLVLSMRRRALPVVQMDHLERYIRAGKPIVAIRVSTVPFQVREAIPTGHVVWDRFDQEVLGCDYQGYDSRSRETGCDVWVEPAAKDHPILKEVAVKFHSPSWLYRQRPLSEDVTVLLRGRWAEDQPEEPVAWVREYNGAKLFYTTLGHWDDFAIPAFNQLLLAAMRWTTDKS